MIEFTNLSGTAWKVGESLTRLENIPQTGYVEFQFNAVAVTFVTSQGVYTDDEIEFYADFYRSSVLSIYDEDKPTMVEILPTGYRWHHEDEKLLYIYFSNGTDEAYTNTDLLTWVVNNCTPSLAQTTWQSNYILTPIGENPRSFIVGEVKLNTSKLPYTLDAPTALYLGGEDDEIVVSFGGYAFNSAGYRIVGGEVTDEKLVTVTFGDGTQPGVFDEDLAAWIESNFTQIKATVGRRLFFGEIITENGQPYYHGEHLVEEDKNYPTSNIIAQYTSGDCKVYIVGSGSSNYTAHVFGNGRMADYQAASVVPWYSYMHVQTGTSYYSRISRVIIHNGVTHVGTCCFCPNTTPGGYTSITNIEIAETVRSAGQYAFARTTLATNITGGKGIRRIYNSFFEKGVNINQILNWDIPNSLAIIGSSSFVGCSFFMNNTDDYMIIGDHCLIKYGINSATLNVPQTVKCLSLFYNPSGGASNPVKQKLTAINFPATSDLRYLDIAALKGHDLRTLDLPSKLYHIGMNAFGDNTNLRKVWIPASVKSIAGGAALQMTSANTPFNGCTNSQLKIFCEATSKPEGWFEQWNYRDATHPVTVVWGASHSDYESY